MKINLYVVIILFSSFQVLADVVLPALISNNMVMQQNSPVHIWGKAQPGEKITISILNQNLLVQGDDNGNWETWLSPMKPATNITMTVKGSNMLEVKNILIGEVWVASGQSNMEWDVSQSNNAEQEIKTATYLNIRLFVVKKVISDTIRNEVEGTWEICSPTSVKNFSAVAYFFGRGLHKKIKSAVGIIEADWGATNCQAWTPMSAMKTDPRLNYILEDWQKFASTFPTRKKNYEIALEQWKISSEQQKKEGVVPSAAPREPLELPKDKPSVLYNGMIAPLTLYTIRGVIWYQGEANAYERVAYPYRYLFPALIQGWRKEWKQGDFPFLFVQLSTLFKHPYWPVLRESQTETLKLKNTAMAVSIDVGDSTDAHYKNKQTIGYRLELAARHLVYNENIESSGPLFRQTTLENNQIRVWFDHAKGLKSNDQSSLKGFYIAGANGIFFLADSKIEGETVILSSNFVQRPIYVRYAFKDAPVVNLVNSVGLPAIPFRTDNK